MHANSFRDLEVSQLIRRLAPKILGPSKRFSKEERYASVGRKLHSIIDEALQRCVAH